MTTAWTDSHFHVDSFEAEGVLPSLLDECDRLGVGTLVSIGGSDEANDTALAVARRHPGRIFATAGYDRDLAGKVADTSRVDSLLKHPEVVAVGETGLDYHYTPETRAEQMALFDSMLSLSARHMKPVIVHSREADADTLDLLASFTRAWPGRPGTQGVLHCYTGGLDFARKLVDLGFLISFSGILTFRNADTLREVARALPLDRILVETDAPFLAPIPHRGQRNQPAWVSHVGEFLARTRGEEVETVAAQTSANAASLFNLRPQSPPRAGDAP